MNVGKLIINALQPLIPNPNPDIPTVAFNVYKGTEKPYITFNYADDRAVRFKDNKPDIDRASMQIHLFIPEPINYMTLKKQIRSRLFGAGFTYPQVSEIYESATKLNHIVFECEIAGESEREE